MEITCDGCGTIVELEEPLTENPRVIESYRARPPVE